jgi:hypothetical protein
MSILSTRGKTIQETPLDEVFVIYGDAGSGKTVLASTFPKTKDAPMLYLDILEGGTGSIDPAYADNIMVVDILKFEELDEVLTDAMNGYTIDENGQQIPVKFSTIVLDSATQMEYLLKEYLKRTSGKSSMNLKLWGEARESQDTIWNLAKNLHKKTGAKIVIICHQKEQKDENDPSFNKLIPSLMTSSASSLCAKASFVWYTKVEKDTIINKDGTTGTRTEYYTYIDAYPYLVTKCRKPVTMTGIPVKAKNLTYDMFERNVLHKLRQLRGSAGQSTSAQTPANTSSKKSTKVVTTDDDTQA